MTLRALFHIQSQHRELHATSLKHLQGENGRGREMYIESRERDCIIKCMNRHG